MIFKQLHGQLLLGVVFVSHALSKYTADTFHHLNRSAEQIVSIVETCNFVCFGNEIRMFDAENHQARDFFDAAGCRYKQTPAFPHFLTEISLSYIALLALQLGATMIAKSFH